MGNGDYVIVWRTGGFRHPASGVFTQRYSAAGVRIGGQTRVDDPIAGRYPTIPSIVSMQDGGYAVAWGVLDEGRNFFSHIRRFAADGSRGHFRQDPYETNIANSGMASLPDGGYVRWVAPYDFTVYGYGLTIQRLRADNTEAGPPVKLEVGHANPGIAARLKNGDLLVTWQTYAQGTNTWVQRFSPDGAPRAAATQVTQGPSSNVSATATALEGGGYALAWQREEGNTRVIITRVYAADGTPVSEEKRADLETGVTPPSCYTDIRTGNLECPAFPSQNSHGVVAMADGGYLLYWKSDTRGSIYYARRYSADGAEIGDIATIGPLGLSVAAEALQTGQVVLTWTGSDGDQGGIWARHH